MLIHSDSDTTYALSSVTGRLVHISEVQRGLACDCICPMCRQPMLANQGEKNQHYFSHERKAGNKYNAEVCREVTMHRVAEQILMDRKNVMLPSYYDIIAAEQIHFVNVELEERNDRTDIQPDIVGITTDGKRYLIEIKYSHSVDGEKKKKIYADDLTCLEIDISKQKMNTLEKFLLHHSDNREWINNKYGFESIVDIYKSKGHDVKVIPCNECRMKDAPENCSSCVKSKIIHRGNHYIICSSVSECQYTRSEKWNRIYDALDEAEERPRRENRLYSSKPSQNYIPLPLRRDVGDENNYPCHPGYLFKSLDDYYNNIKCNAIFYRKSGKEYSVTNYWKGTNKFGVVLTTKGEEKPFSYVVVSLDNVFIHNWSNAYCSETHAVLYLKKELGIED